MQVQIRHSGGNDVSLDDCAQFSGPMGEAIETSKIMREAYVLEVSSPGISENLSSDKDFETFKGFPIEVIFSNHQKPKLSARGLLHERTISHLHLNIKGRINRIPLEDVITVRLSKNPG